MQYEKQKILTKFDSLIELADGVWEETLQNNGVISPVNMARLRSHARHLLNMFLPGSKIYLEEWDGLSFDGTKRPNAGWYKGILVAAKEDYEKGFFGDQKILICAEVFADFLQQAEHLLREDYKDAAAVIAGSVLEDGLRRLCDLKQIEYGEKDTMHPLNQKLYREKVYTKLWFEKIKTMAVIRNDAAHGKFESYGEKDVKGLIEFIKDLFRTFLETQ